MQNYLQKAINLAKKTGDRLIIFDTNKPENSFVLMGLDEYEKIVAGKSEVRGLTEDELLDKINRDIAIWKSDNEYEKNIPNTPKISNRYNRLENFGDFEFYDEDDDEDDFEEFEEEDDDEDSLDDEMYYYDEPMRVDNRRQKTEEDHEEGFKPKNFWRIPKDVEKGAEEII